MKCDFDFIDCIVCDDGCTQPLGYGRDKNDKMFFTVSHIVGFGALSEPSRYTNITFDEIVPFSNLSGMTYIATRNNEKWHLWRYYECNDEYGYRPSEYYLFDRRILEEIPMIQGNSMEEVFRKYSKQAYDEYLRFRKNQ